MQRLVLFRIVPLKIQFPNTIAMDKATVFLCILITLCHVILSLKAKESNGSSEWKTLDENFVDNDSSSKPEIPITVSTPSNSSVLCAQTKHEDFCKCRKHGLVAYLSDEFSIRNGTAHVSPLNASYGPLFYELDGNDLLICKPAHMMSDSDDDRFTEDDVYTYITLIGLSISIICLTLHLIAFALVPDLRNIPGCCMACLCGSLLAAFVSFLVGFDEYIRHSRGPCYAVAFSILFFMLSSLLWMNVMAFDVLKSLLNAVGKFRAISSKMTFKNFYVYCLYAWGIGLMFASVAVISDNTPNFPEEYKPKFGNGTCWFKQRNALLLFFAAPVFTLICMNVFFFGTCVYIIISHTMKPTDPQRSMLKRNVTIYSRLAVIMGLSWVFGLLASLLNHVVLWYIFVILNTLQGFFIFVAFTCTPKVKKYFVERLCFDQTKYSVHTGCSHEKSSETVAKNSDLRTTENI